jgi:ATP-dependent Clp protease adaptor protein ClpS
MSTDVQIDEKIGQTVKEPSKYRVVFHNDDRTPMEFVVELLMTIFKHTQVTAEELTLKVHNEGTATVGVYAYEIAESKGVEATTLSRANGFPLVITVEEDA